MLEIRRCAIALEAEELVELERIVMDADREEALRFLRRFVYDKVLHSQQGQLKCHLDTAHDTVKSFHADNGQRR